MTNSSSRGEALILAYVKRVEGIYRLGNATEHSYRPALQELLEGFDRGVTATNEPKKVKRNAPDYVITRETGNGRFTVGYVEAKDVVDVSLDKVEGGEQMGRYKRALENLLLTDYLEFRWFVKGERQPLTARIATIGANKLLLVNKDEIKKLETLLGSFLGRPFEHIRRPEELARRMARLTHIIRDTVEEVFAKKVASETLNELFEAFKAVLLPDLPVPQFADMFAQTLAYGLFAARYNHKGTKEFDRHDAAREIPKTNPFLRKLFTTIAGSDFDEEPFIGYVNELTQVLQLTDMDAVLADFGKRTRQEDPIVHFYETFLAQYDPKLRELRGVYYTPEPVVSYIVRSVDILLREEFDCPDGLADSSTILRSYTDEEGKTQTERMPRVLLLDPACGTGTFSYNIIDNIRQTFRQSNNAGMWSSYVRESLLPRLFGFELLMAPYAVAHLKLGMQLAALDLPPHEREDWAYDFASDERLGIYLTNTLEQTLGTGRAKLLLGGFISDEANEAAKVKQDYPVMVIVGNPPYSGSSQNKGKYIDDLMGVYKEAVHDEYNIQPLSNDYIKFIRFAHDRIERTKYGIVGIITSNSYLSGLVHRGMREELLKSFGKIFIINLHGNSLMGEKAPEGGVDENVFDIRQGVAIAFFVRTTQNNNATGIYYLDLWGARKDKYKYLVANDINTTSWQTIQPSTPHFFFVPKDLALQKDYEEGPNVTEVFPIYQRGVATRRDHFMVGLSKDELEQRFSIFTSDVSDEQISEMLDVQTTSHWSLPQARSIVRQRKSISDTIKKYAYRPFDNRQVAYLPSLIERGDAAYQVMQHMLQSNKALLCFRRIRDDISLPFFVASGLIDKTILSSRDNATALPLYLYPDPKQQTLLDIQEPSTAPGGRRPNLSPAFVSALGERVGLRFVADGRGDLQETFGPEDVFAYMYAVFHAPTYRARYAEFLKIDFPRLPLTSDVDLFRALCGLGGRLVALHLMEAYSKTVVPSFPVKGNNVVEKVEYQEPSDANGQVASEGGRVYINKTQYFGGVPTDVWAFHVGGYQVCHKWLKDRKGRTLGLADIQHYGRVVGALAETIVLMERVDEVIEEHGGWPLG